MMEHKKEYVMPKLTKDVVAHEDAILSGSSEVKPGNNNGDIRVEDWNEGTKDDTLNW